MISQNLWVIIFVHYPSELLKTFVLCSILYTLLLSTIALFQVWAFHPFSDQLPCHSFLYVLVHSLCCLCACFAASQNSSYVKGRWWKPIEQTRKSTQFIHKPQIFSMIILWHSTCIFCQPCTTITIFCLQWMSRWLEHINESYCLKIACPHPTEWLQWVLAYNISWLSQ